MSNTPYKRTKELIRVSQVEAKFRNQFGRVVNPDDLGHFPSWIWPYIRRAYKAGKFTKDFSIPTGAKIDDYSLYLLPVIKQAGIEFPGYEIGDLPVDFLKMVKGAVSAKLMDQYGKVTDPDVLPRIPKPLWPYVKGTFKLGTAVGLILEGEDIKDFPVPIQPYIEAIKKKK